ncbi:MAG TPA: xanthine dehydrogenase family protein molybdopterin-binding subunit [Acetobacteraceae bacterium]|nr:xanthine dehydrogenase family protein molybdopterin-binding subunit [Acetobacteraceae bacterium]
MKYRDIRQPNYRHVGKYSPRKEARELVTGKALFLDDFSLPHMLIGRTKRSPYPHARIVKIDTAEAEALEGVRAVITHKNAPFLAGLGWPVHRLVLEPKVFYVGDQVAIVAAETQEIANEAIDLIEVEYEQLPAVFTAADALKEGAPQLYERFPGNLVDPGCPYFQPDGPFWQVKRGDPDKAIAEADFVAEDEISFSKMPCPLAPEAPSVIVRYDGNQHYTVWASSQSSHIMKLLMQAYVPGSQIDVNTFNVGGSYGNKQTMLNAAVSAALLANVTKRPVKVVLSKAEQLMAYEVRLGSTIKATMAANKEGIVTAVKGDWLVDTGCVCNSTQGQIGVGLGEAQLVLAKCENWFLDSHIAVTNRQQAGIVRGYGGQELNSCLEKLLCAIMKEGGFDPLDVFKKNYVSHGDKYVWRDGRTYRSRSSFFFPEVMQQTAERFGWSEKWKGWFKPTCVNGTKARGVGMGVIGNADIQEDNTEAIVRIVPNLDVANVGGGSSLVVVECDITESGMGQRSNACKVVAEVFNCPYEWVSITDPGTRHNPSNFGLCGSRGTITTGKAVSEAALDARRQAMELAAIKLDRAVDQLEMRDMEIYVRDTPELRIAVSRLADRELSIVGYGKHVEKFDCPSCIAVFVEVEVDLDTGLTEVVRLAGGSDVGQIIDSKALEMQLHGGIGSASLDTAIFEECNLDPSTGRLLASSLIDYKWRTFNDLPRYDGFVMESQIDTFMFKALGIGEVTGAALASAALMAISNAIGVDVKEYPATPAVVLEALGKA